jgi:hypothetical protein
LTKEDLREAEKQAANSQSFTNPAIRKVLGLVSSVRGKTKMSDERKGQFLCQMKSLMVFRGAPFIYLTLNPADRHSPLVLSLAGERINLREFSSADFTASERFQKALKNPLAVHRYFHTVVQSFIEVVLKGGLFGEMGEHFGVIEYQGRHTPHIHMVVHFFYETGH